MRITGYRMIDLSRTTTSAAQEAVAEASSQVSTGLKITKPSDDPSAWSAGQRAKLQQTLSRSTSSAVGASRDRLQQTDGAVGTLSGILSQVRALVVQSANASYNAEDRAKMAETMRGFLATAVATANTPLDSGEYALAGTQSTVPPFNADGTYNGDDTSRMVTAGANATSVSTIPGSRLTAAYGVDVLPLLGQIATSLDANDLTALNANLGDLDTAVKQVALTRTVTGGAMAVLDSTAAAHDKLVTNLAKTIQDDVEVDTIAAASDLAKASSQLNASQMVTAHLIQLLNTQNQG